MRENIENALRVEVEGVNVQKATRIEFYLRQGDLFFQYAPEATDEKTLLVDIPFEDARQLTQGSASVQIALTDENGNKVASDIASVPVRELLKGAGYD